MKPNFLKWLCCYLLWKCCKLGSGTFRRSNHPNSQLHSAAEIKYSLWIECGIFILFEVKKSNAKMAFLNVLFDLRCCYIYLKDTRQFPKKLRHFMVGNLGPNLNGRPLLFNLVQCALSIHLGVARRFLILRCQLFLSLWSRIHQVFNSSLTNREPELGLDCSETG